MVKESPSTTTPSGHRVGVFPRDHLIEGEVILWEGKPNVLAYILRPLFWLFISFLIAGIGFVTELIPLILLGGLVFLLAGILMLIRLIAWSRARFAISNNRIMTQYGFFSVKFADCLHDRVQNSTILQPFFQSLLGFGEVMFATGGTIGGINSRSAKKLMSTGGGILWIGVTDPTSVKRYADEVIERSRNEKKRSDYQTMAGVLRDSKKAEHGTDDVSGSRNDPQGINGPIEEKLRRIKKMHDDGLITQTEYDELKKRILDSV